MTATSTVPPACIDAVASAQAAPKSACTVASLAVAVTQPAASDWTRFEDGASDDGRRGAGVDVAGGDERRLHADGAIDRARRGFEVVERLGGWSGGRAAAGGERERERERD